MITNYQCFMLLKTVSRSITSKRHADLAMRAYPLLRSELGWNFKASSEYLDKVLLISDSCAPAWRELARLSGELDNTTPYHKQMSARFTKLLATYKGNSADIALTRDVFRELMAHESEPKKRLAIFQQGRQNIYT